jgi:hypothetical protein
MTFIIGVFDNGELAEVIFNYSTLSPFIQGKITK